MEVKNRSKRKLKKALKGTKKYQTYIEFLSIFEDVKIEEIINNENLNCNNIS